MTMKRLGYLLFGPLADAPSPQRVAFFQRLRELGHVERRNLAVEYRSAEWQAARLQPFARELAGLPVDVIFANDTESATEVKRSGVKVPVVAHMHDPVGLGLAGSLARPGGNITGLSIIAPDLAGKRLELLKEVLPKLRSVTVMWNPASEGAATEWRATREAARGLGIEVVSLEVREAQELLRAFERVKAQRPPALAVLSDVRMISYRKLIADFAATERIPTLFAFAEFASAGGLLSYGVSLNDLYRRSAGYVDRVLRGVRPGDLPIEQPTMLELVVNLKVARSLGVSIPQSVLLRADQVIE
jgi:putative ABC transport system substrate-binding protein